MAERRITWSLIVLAIMARGAAVLVLQSHHVPHSTYEHGEIAANLLAGRGFSVRFLGADGPTSQQAPLYPFLVAGAYAMGGVGTPQSLLILELGQAVLGGLLVAAVLCLAREVAPERPRTAIFAGLIAALHPTLVYAATHVQVALLAATLLTASLAWAFRLARTGRARDAIICGLFQAALALTDPILVLVGPGIVWAVARERAWRETIRLCGIMTAALILGVCPWIIRNARVHGELVLIKSTFGYAFWQGNCSLSEGTDKVVRPSVEHALRDSRGGLRGMNESLWKARHEAGYLDDVALTKADYQVLSQVSEPERSRILFRRAIEDLRRDPGRYIQLCLRRLRYFMLFDETNPKTRNVIYRASHLGLTLLALAGLCVAGPDLRKRLGPTILTVMLITLFHSLTIVSARFHLPIEPILALWGGTGLGSIRLTSATDDVKGVRVRKLSLDEVVFFRGVSRHVRVGVRTDDLCP